MYDLSALGINTDVEPGTNILVAGPPMTGKRELGIRILAAGADQGQGSIVVSTRDGAGRIIDQYRDVDGTTAEGAFGIVDCVSQQRGDAGLEDDDRVKYANSPADMAGIGTAFSAFLEAFWSERGLRDNRVLLDSVSTLLMYHNLETVFRFLHVFTRRIDTANALGVFLIDTTAHDDQTRTTLLQLFDTVLTVNDSGDGNQSSLQLERT